MPTVQLKIVGSSYESRTIPLSAQVTRNLYPEPVANGASTAALLSWPGCKLFSAQSGFDRGIVNWKDQVYVVSGNDLVKIDSAGERTRLGTILGGARCVFAGGPEYLYIVSDGLVFRCDGAAVEAVLDEDLESPSSVAFLNSQFIYDGNQGRFAVSAPGDGSSISGLSYATAESSPDELVRVYVFNQVVYLFGTTSCEPWYNSGVDSPPFDRIEGGLFQVGIAGVHSVTNTDKALYFLGHDRTVYRLEGYVPVQVSTVAINNAIENYNSVSDCFMFFIKLQGQSFVVLTFPSANKTWVFSETFNQWFELSSGVSGGRHLANGYCYAYGKHLITDHRNGNIYQWDLDTYTDNGESIIRERVTQPIDSDAIAEPGKEIFWNKLELVLNSGKGRVTGQGSDPMVMLQFSDDNGYTWSNELWGSAGRLGAYKYKVIWEGLGSSVSRIYRFRFSDPVELNLFKLFADIEVGI